MKLTKSNDSHAYCNREHYSCPSWHRWDLERTAKWAFSALGFLVVGLLVTAFFLWMFNNHEEPQVKAAKVQAEAQDKAQFLTSCEN